MKKLIFLVVCVLTAMLALVGCDEGIGSDLQGYLDKGYGDSVKKELIELDLYIIADEGNDTFAEKTVKQAISQYTREHYKVELDIHFLHADEYKQAVLSGVALTGKDKADIVLINSKELYDELMQDGALAPLDPYLNSDTVKNYVTIDKNIPKIKKDVPSCLWDAVAASPDDDGNTCFVIPNNRVIGSYKYLSVNREQFFAKGYSENIFADSNLDIDALIAAFDSEGISYIIDENGSYADKARYESEGNICVVLANPTVDAEYALLSGFSVVKGTGYEDRATEIIYAINTVSEVRNLLQYGVKVTHYSVVNGDIVYNTNPDSGIYRMNLLYTGNIFTADYCSALGWTAEARADAQKQNESATVVIPE